MIGTIFVKFSQLILIKIIRPPDIVVCGLLFYHGFFLRLLSFFRHLLSALAEWNSTKTGHMLGSDCNLKMHVRNLGYPIPLQIRGTKTTFFNHFTT